MGCPIAGLRVPELSGDREGAECRAAVAQRVAVQDSVQLTIEIRQTQTVGRNVDAMTIM
jgi:hypothetical protein